MQRALLLFASLSCGIAATASAQLGATSISGASTLRDGSELWSFSRDAHDPSRVIASSPRGGTLRARVDDHALVRVAPGVDARALFRALELVEERAVAPRLGIYRVRGARGEDGLALAERLASAAGPSRPLVDAIPDWIVAHRVDAISIPPDDPRYAGQWYLDEIEIEDAWHLSSGDPSVTIVVIDTGCDGAHVDLVANVDPGRDVIDADDDPTPTAGEAGNGHGTACAGLAAAATDNGEGIAGACPECRLRCVRMLGGEATEIPISADIDAFQFALDVDAAVVSNSWGFVDPTPIPDMLRTMIEAVVDTGRGGHGALVLFAAGNDDRELFDYELEAVRGVITVGAVNNFDEATPYSNHGESVDLVAPTGTLSTDITGADGADPGDYTSSFGGTSSACPIAAGVAGLLASAAPDRSGAELADALIHTARPSIFATPDAMGHDVLYGYGRIDPAAALRRVLGIPEPEPDAGPIAVDAGARDAGIDGGVQPSPSGCGCRIAHDRSSAGLALVALALFTLRRRRG